MRLAENTGWKNDAKNRHLGTIPQLCRAISLQLRHVSTIRKKRVKQQYLLHMSPQYGELRLTSGWDRFGSLEHPSYFQRLPRLGSITARQSSSEHQANFAALNRGRHLCLAGRPSRWALAHISRFILLFVTQTNSWLMMSLFRCSTHSRLMTIHLCDTVILPVWPCHSTCVTLSFHLYDTVIPPVWPCHSICVTLSFHLYDTVIPPVWHCHSTCVTLSFHLYDTVIPPVWPCHSTCMTLSFHLCDTVFLMLLLRALIVL